MGRSIKLMKCEHFDEDIALPKYETKDAAGADIRASLEDKKSLIIKPAHRVLVPTGLCIEIPQGHEVQGRPRSG